MDEHVHLRRAPWGNKKRPLYHKKRPLYHKKRPAYMPYPHPGIFRTSMLPLSKIFSFEHGCTAHHARPSRICVRVTCA